MEKSKIGAYLGFCVRSRHILFGVDNVEKQRKNVFLLLADEQISENSLKVMIKAKEKFACPLLITDKGTLGELVHRPTVKAVGVTDKNLASAILSVSASELQLKLYSGGNNERYGKEI